MRDLTAILLCGGKGERLKPFTDLLPKALVPLNGKPILLYLIRYLEAAGISRFVVCTGYKAEAIEEFIGQTRRPRLNPVCVNSGDVTMTERIRAARPHVPDAALICYGDTVANVDIAELLKHHHQAGAEATLTVHPLRSSFGIVNFDERHQIASFEEKPLLPYWINIGFLVCEARALDRIRPNSDMPEFLGELARNRVLSAFPHQGKHLTINTEKERVLAEAEIIDLFTV
jgi:NDP-sugar pyrophosphorylase family protein